MSITILIPTCSRPEFLKKALDSVARQMIIEKIDSVVVMENGGSEASRAICDWFIYEWRLPIIYKFRVPQTNSASHGRLIWKEHAQECRSEFTAILHDDDFWLPNHLENALKCLTRSKEVSFYGSSHFDVIGGHSLLSSASNIFAAFALQFPSVDQRWIVREQAMRVAQSMGGICHYSTMVCRTEALKKSTHIFDLPIAEFDTDRMIQAELSRHGPMIYNPLPEAFIRQHMGRDCVANFTKEERIKHFCATTRWIVERSGEKANDLLKRFETRFDAAPELHKKEIMDCLNQPWVLPTLQNMALAEMIG
jgi:hypothetical protein